MAAMEVDVKLMKDVTCISLKLVAVVDVVQTSRWLLQ